MSVLLFNSSWSSVIDAKEWPDRRTLFYAALCFRHSFLPRCANKAMLVMTRFVSSDVDPKEGPLQAPESNAYRV